MLKYLSDIRPGESHFPKLQKAFAKISNESTVSKIIEVVKFIILMPWLLISDSALYLDKLIRRDVKKISIMDKFFRGLAVEHQSKIIKTTVVGIFLLVAVYSSSRLQEFFGLIDSNQNRSWFNNIEKKHAFIFSGVSIVSVIGWKWLKSDFRPGEKSNKKPEVRKKEKSISEHPEFKTLESMLKEIRDIAGKNFTFELYDQLQEKTAGAKKIIGKIKKDQNFTPNGLERYSLEIQEIEGRFAQEKAEIEFQMFKSVDGKFTEMESLCSNSPDNLDLIANLFNYTKNNLNLCISSEHYLKQLDGKHKIALEKVRSFAVVNNFKALKALNEKRYDSAIELSQKVISLFNKLSFIDNALEEKKKSAELIFNSSLTEKIKAEKESTDSEDDEKTKD